MTHRRLTRRPRPLCRLLPLPTPPCPSRLRVTTWTDGAQVLWTVVYFLTYEQALKFIRGGYS